MPMTVPYDDDARCAVGTHEATRKPCCQGCDRTKVMDGWLHWWVMGQPQDINGQWQCALRVPAKVEEKA